MPRRPANSQRVSAAAESLTRKIARMDVVRAAVDVFADKGYRDTRVEDLLEAAGIARRTFYKYFRNKEAVLVALYGHVTTELVEGVLGAVASPDDPLGSLRDALDFYLHFHLVNHRILRVLIEEATRAESELAPLRARLRGQLVQAVDMAYTLATGRRADPFVFLALVSGLEGLSLEILQGEPDEAKVARVRDVILGLLDALVANPEAVPHQ